MLMVVRDGGGVVVVDTEENRTDDVDGALGTILK